MKRLEVVRVEQIGLEYAVYFSIEECEDWGYMGMADRASWVSTGKYEVCVVPYDKYTGTAHNIDAGHVAHSFKTRKFDKDMANRIWWNVKNGIGYKELLAGLKALDLVAVER